jgi:hypothetical protein
VRVTEVSLHLVQRLPLSQQDGRRGVSQIMDSLVRQLENLEEEREVPDGGTRRQGPSDGEFEGRAG